MTILPRPKMSLADKVSLFGWLGVLLTVPVVIVLISRPHLKAILPIESSNEPIKVANEVHNIRTVEIDGCEYLYGHPGGGADSVVLTHKGDCKNPIHQK